MPRLMQRWQGRAGRTVNIGYRTIEWLDYNRHKWDELFGNGSKHGWLSFSLGHLYGLCLYVVVEKMLNLLNSLLEYHCACAFEQKLEEVEKLKEGEVFSWCLSGMVLKSPPVHSEDKLGTEQRNKCQSFGHGMWQHSKRWSKLKGMSNMSRTGIGAVLMIHLAGLTNSSEISSKYLWVTSYKFKKLCSPRYCGPKYVFFQC